MKKSRIIALTSAAIIAALPAIADAEGIIGPTITGSRFDVTATGEVTRVPDIAVISAGVVTQAKDAKSALTENANRMSRVLAALKAAGIAPRDVTTSNISLSPQYRYAENQVPVITGYQASNTVTVRFRDIGKSGSILDSLVSEGANQINGPSLQLDDPAAALDEARLKAFKAARSRADLYAKAAGMTVKRIVTLSESSDMGNRPMPMMMAMARAKPAADTEIAAGEQAISVTLSVTFELN